MTESSSRIMTPEKAPGILPAAIILGLMWLAIGATHLGEPGIAQFMVRVMGAPFSALLATLVWLAGRYEVSQLQARIERDATEAVADIRTAVADALAARG